MNTNKIILIGKLNAIAILVLGIIHDIATYTPLIRGGILCLHPDTQNALLYMSLICGASFILSGILLLMLLKMIEQNAYLNSIILVIGVFLMLSGILSVIYMFNNPFAWIALFLNLTMFIITIRLKMTFRKQTF